MVLSRRRILLIEDEESIAEPLVEALEREGFDVVTAPTATSAARATRPSTRTIRAAPA